MGDYEMDEEAAADMEQEEPIKTKTKLKSVVATDGGSKKQKGRGFKDSSGQEERFGNVEFESLENVRSTGPAKSVEGWAVFVTGVHEEAQEEDIHEAFAEYGDIKNIYLNLDRQTGFVKGYALVEYASRKEAQDAIDAMHQKELLTQKISVDWAFTRGPLKKTAK
jgi:RNA-binding protein 8A